MRAESRQVIWLDWVVALHQAFHYFSAVHHDTKIHGQDAVCEAVYRAIQNTILQTLSSCVECESPSKSMTILLISKQPHK